MFSNITIKAQKRLICWQMGSQRGTPAYLIDHWVYIETLPFDGVVIFPANYRYQAVMQPGQTVTYQEIYFAAERKGKGIKQVIWKGNSE